ncbi:hypothetical protein LTR95_004967 [Oleoguttula sp. CCFEE 5521]
MSRYHPAVIAGVSIAAAYSIYIIYTVTSADSGKRLHRSNAVRRSRRERPSHGMDGGLEEPDVLHPVEVANTEVSVTADEDHSQGLKALLYHIAEDNAKRRGFQHRGIFCEGCGMLPIRHTRYHCLNCADYDLCSSCEATTQHPITHVFAKIKIPLPVLSQPSKPLEPWYPGKLTHFPQLQSPQDIKELSQSLHATGYDIAAWWEQFHCLANAELVRPDDSRRAAINRRAFDLAMTSHRWHGRPPSVHLYDRVFAFYDIGSKGAISFDDFSHGMAYLRGGNRFRSLEPALRGYDMDNDGYLDRADFLRMFRAKYLLDSQITADLIEMAAEAHTRVSLDKIKSSQPLSALFHEDDVPVGAARPLHGKAENVYHDLEPLPGIRTIIDDDTNDAHRASHDQQRLIPMDRTPSREADTPSELDQPRTGTTDLDIDLEKLDEDDMRMLGIIGDDHATETASSAKTSDLMWHVLEEGFEKMLEPIFNGVEANDEGVVRMSFENIIQKASEDEEMRGLITSWLQYASF